MAMLQELRRRPVETKITQVMSTTMKAAHKLNGLSPEGKLSKADAGIVEYMVNSGNFPENEWPIPKASVQQAITDLRDAIKAVEAGTPGAVSHMHETERQLVAVFNLLRSYVELKANKTTDPKTIIESAGMTAYLPGGGSGVSDLTLDAIGNGVVEVSVPRNKGEVAFVYQYSTDGGKTWLAIETSKLATVQLKGQAPGSTISVRYAPIGSILGGFSQPKSVMVM